MSVAFNFAPTPNLITIAPDPAMMRSLRGNVPNAKWPFFVQTDRGG
ncbi:hypothetical protein ARMA_2686 [Ardenticatena maritima]|uniref:Uncharacterized protein n=1 Tax=Ardenticatena maritima TaxID=872965 RepID=A0A0M8K902_9CHLR|nr:hypothetical protein ARMA_2686 [Ardenticatena maritima]